MYKKKTITRRLTMAIIAFILIQTILVGVLLVSGGVLRQIKDNAYESLERTVTNRAFYLYTEMMNHWSNISYYTGQVSEKLPLLSDSSIAGAKNKTSFFLAAEPIMLSMMEASKVTDCYIILNDNIQDSRQHSSLYFRDDDPALGSENGSDICLLAGPQELTNKYASLEDWWSYTLTLPKGGNDFYYRPYNAATKTADASLFGYWSQPFCLNSSDSPRIAYSMPLTDADGTLYGVIGIAVSLSYIGSFLPSEELAQSDSLGYLIAYQDGSQGELQPILCGGAYQERILHTDKPLILSEKDFSRKIYLLKEHRSKKTIYACQKKLGLYQANTPFEEEEWYVIGLQEQNQLLNLMQKTENAMVYSILLAIVLGIAGGSIISHITVKPITTLIHEVQASNPMDGTVIKKTGLYELDELTDAINAGNDSIAATARRLKYERDYDALTQLCGRRFFRTSVTEILKQRDFCTAAMVMMDVDNFKQINDTYGHAFGDFYLKETARLLKEITCSGCIVGRRSGDEFFVFFYDFSSKEEIRQLLRCFYKKLSCCPLDFPDGKNQCIYISAGLAWVSPEQNDYDILLAQADETLYRIKKEKKGFFWEY